MANKKTSDIVFENIQERILSGEWAPGMKIMPETQIAKELNVSRVSVREAIEKMVALNIISKRQGEGNFVNVLSPYSYLNNLVPMITLEKHDSLDILEFRMILEVESSKLCATRCNVETVAQMEKCFNSMVAYQDDYEEFSEEDLKFHMLIAKGSCNPLIIKVSEIFTGILRYHQRFLYELLGPSGGINDHRNILEAIKSRDAELAGLFAKRHIERTIIDLKLHDQNI